ncbi:MAG: hypothetical protein ABIG60_04080 [Patescibacteria group bacterium]
MGNLLSLKYWINLRPGPLLASVQQYFIYLIIILFIISVIFWLLKTKKQGIYLAVWQKLFNFSVLNTIVGLFFLFFTYELVPFLSARFWFLLWAIGDIVWLIFIFKALVKIPAKKKKRAEEKEYRKYIP